MKMRMLNILVFSLLGLSGLAEASLPPIKPGVPGKKKGDIIAPMLDEQVAAWCDFSKQIIMTRSNILCAYNGEAHPSPPPSVAENNFPPLRVKALPPKKMVKAKPVPMELDAPYQMSEYGDA